MLPRYGLIVQMAQFLAQLFLDWCAGEKTMREPFAFVVPRSALTGLPEEFEGVLVTVSALKRTNGRLNKQAITRSIYERIRKKYRKIRRA